MRYCIGPEEVKVSEQDPTEIDIRFAYHPPVGDQQGYYNDIREQAKRFAVTIEQMCPNSREKALAFTNLEQAVMWANAAIARRS